MSDLKNRTTLGAPAGSTPTPRLRNLVATGVVATLVAMAAVAATVALAKAVGVDLAMGEEGEVMPASGAAVMAGIFCAVGVVLAVVLRARSARPATTFLRTAATLTALSLVPPFFSGGDAATVASLILLHLVAAAVMVPALVRALRA